MSEAAAFPEFKVVISDLHLSAGHYVDGLPNPHEDFHYDEELCRLIDHFTRAEYGAAPDGSPVRVELFINGDFLDPLNVPVHGEFDVLIPEEVALAKIEAIFRGHAHVMAALKRFAGRPGKRITYLIGNHDADLLFPKVRERITREWDPDGAFPSPVVEVIGDRDRVRWAGGVEVQHGNQYEALHALDFEAPTVPDSRGRPVLNLPWGSTFLLKVVYPMKWERDYLDKIRPIKLYLLIGLLFDTGFTLRYMAHASVYFLRTRFVLSGRTWRKFRESLAQTWKILRQETWLFLDLENEARARLREDPSLRTVICGHTHQPMNRVFPDGKQYINTGTWTKMTHLDWRQLGQQLRLTFALVRIEGDQARCELREWVGEAGPHRVFQG